MAGPTLTQIRQRMGQLAGTFLSSTATTSTAALLSDTAWPAASSTQAATLYQDMYLFTPAAVLASDKVRTVALYSPSATTGDFTPDHNWTTAPTGLAYEVHLFEPLTAMLRMINEGLKMCMVPVEFTFTPANNLDTRHSLATAAPWLTNPAWIKRVGVLSAATLGRSVEDPYSRGPGLAMDKYIDGGTMYLAGRSFNTTDTVYVRAMKPAYWGCGAAATPTVFTQQGLILEADVVPDSVTLEWAACAGMVQAWREFQANLAADARVVGTMAKAIEAFHNADPGLEELEIPGATRVQHAGPRH